MVLGDTCILLATKGRMKTVMQMKGESRTWDASELPRREHTGRMHRTMDAPNTLRKSQARGRCERIVVPLFTRR